MISCNKEENDNIAGSWKQNGVTGDVRFPDDYCYFEINSNTINVLSKDMSQTASFTYTVKGNKLTLDAPFAGKYKSMTIDYVSYSEETQLGQMTWNCGEGQCFYFIIWTKEE